jgi:hypothetical protein
MTMQHYVVWPNGAVDVHPGAGSQQLLAWYHSLEHRVQQEQKQQHTA